jgi:hypothetical protein
MEVIETTENKTIHEGITKKTAAFEMYSKTKQSRNLKLVSVAGLIVSNILTIFAGYEGVIVGFSIAAILVFFIHLDVQYINYLNSKYNIEPKQPAQNG